MARDIEKNELIKAITSGNNYMYNNMKQPIYCKNILF
jgi:hypothetical protein